MRQLLLVVLLWSVLKVQTQVSRSATRTLTTTPSNSPRQLTPSPSASVSYVVNSCPVSSKTPCPVAAQENWVSLVGGTCPCFAVGGGSCSQDQSQFCTTTSGTIFSS